MGRNDPAFASSYATSRKNKILASGSFPYCLFYELLYLLLSGSNPRSPDYYGNFFKFADTDLPDHGIYNFVRRLFGIGFWSVEKALPPDSHVRDYMIITAIGFILYFNRAQSIVLQAGHSRFGLANVSFVGLSAYLILSGLSNSAISVANDVRLRQAINNSAKKESRLLGSIGTVWLAPDRG